MIPNEQRRTALRQQYDATAAIITRWQRDLRAGVPTAQIVNLVGANLYMFLSSEAEVLRRSAPLARRLPNRRAAVRAATDAHPWWRAAFFQRYEAGSSYDRAGNRRRLHLGRDVGRTSRGHRGRVVLT